MEIRFASDSIAFTNAMKNITAKKMKKLEKFPVVDDAASVRFTDCMPGHMAVEIRINTKSGRTYKAVGKAADYYASVDEAVDKLTDQLRRDKTERDIKKKAQDISRDFAPESEDDAGEEEEDERAQ